MRLYTGLGDDASALRCIGMALQCDQGNYDAHYQAAASLLGREMFAEAETHVRWCLQRKPGDQTLAQLLRQAMKGRLDGQRRAAVEIENAPIR
jgi:hypothetical protein